MTDGHTHELPPIKIAIILDGVIQDVLHTDERLAALFLSNPLIVDVSHLFQEDTAPNLVGLPYVSGDQDAV